MAKQYGHWMGGAIHGDLGQSLAPPRGPVMLRLREAFPVTIELAVLAALIALVVAVPLGILAAYRAGSRVDSMINGMAYGLVSVPNFLAGLLIAYLFTVQLRIFPRSQWVRVSASFTGNLRSAFLPAAANVTNITVQKQCVLDASDHLEIAADPIALADMLNALDPATPVHVPCLVVLPVTGPTGPVPSL